MMSTFLKKIILFALSIPIVLLVCILLTSAWVMRNDFENDETESNTLVLKENQNYDLAFMGISHARNFSRFQNHDKTAKTLNRTILNLGQGASSCGASEQLFYLRYSYQKNNTIDTILYILSPPLLYSNQLNLASTTFELEPFNLSFFFQYLKHPGENKVERLREYVASKLGPTWIAYKPKKWLPNTDTLDAMDTALVKAGFELAYPNGLQNSVYEKTCNTLIETVQTAKQHQTAVIFIIPPALFGKWEGHEETLAFCNSMKQKYGCGCIDLSMSVLEPRYYYDHHHLNSAGVHFFVEQYLKPAIR